jgi:hypothetical protein
MAIVCAQTVTRSGVWQPATEKFLSLSPRPAKQKPPPVRGSNADEQNVSPHDNNRISTVAALQQSNTSDRVSAMPAAMAVNPTTLLCTSRRSCDGSDHRQGRRGFDLVEIAVTRTDGKGRSPGSLN